MKLVSAVPVVPSQDIAATTTWYRDTLGFAVFHIEGEYGIVGRDDVYIHFWGPSGIKPMESTTSIRLGVADIEEWHAHCIALDIVHTNAPLQAQPWGATEFGITDIDGNLVMFFEFNFGEDA